MRLHFSATDDAYNDVETDSCQIQRELLLKILDEMMRESDQLVQCAELICQSAETNLTAEVLLSWSDLLASFRFEDAFEAELPGEEINVDGAYYYQVDVEAACELLNEYFNPLQNELEEFDVQFRQKHTSQGLGETSDFEANNTTRPTTTGGQEPIETEPTEDDEPIETEESTDDEPIETEEPTENDEPIETEEPTQNEPIETADPTESVEPTETPEPLEPNDPDGNE